MRIYLIAVEPSADHLGAELAQALRAELPRLSLAGIGGPKMQAIGIPSQMPTEGLAIIGFTEVLTKIPVILEGLKQSTARILEAQPDAVILIDSYGFMIRLAKRLRKAGYNGKIIKYVAPQVWATRPKRAKVLADHVDGLLAIHSFEPDWFTPHGLDTHYVGNAVFDTDYGAGDPNKLRQQYNLSDRPILSVFLGSRVGEVVRLSPAFTDAVQILRQRLPDLAILCPVSESVAKEVGAQAAKDLRMNDMILLPESAKLDAMSCSMAALACSGTVTTQLACAGVPTVVAYRMSPVTHAIVSRIFQPNHISIVNIAANEKLMPEFLQNEVTGEALADALIPYLSDTKKRAAARDALLEQTRLMAGQPDETASARAAQAILQILD
ncbi:lipid-A-disaccharide synthase [Litorimonas sp. WD9-15]|uniref:lipid-A-disaccharide synthase n=1 Tax=Litorimonas sp. WD9-15 TaxID=3418716 RepID=UPI003CFCD6EA